MKSLESGSKVLGSAAVLAAAVFAFGCSGSSDAGMAAPSGSAGNASGGAGNTSAGGGVGNVGAAGMNASNGGAGQSGQAQAGNGGAAGGNITPQGGAPASGGAGAGGMVAAGGAGPSNGTSVPAVIRTENSSQYVTTGADGKLSATSSTAGKPETFTLIDVNGGSLADGDLVQLKASNGKFLSAVNGGGAALAATAATAGADETFTITRIAGAGAIANGDQIVLETKAGDYISADMGGGGDVLANQTHAQAWETFTIYLNGMIPVTPPGSTAKQKVLDYFNSISGKKTIFGIENKGTLHDDTDHVKSLVGKQPGFWGNDFGFGSGAVNQRAAMAQEAIKQWNAGAVVGLMYHACAPTRDELCSWDDVGGAHPQHLSSQQWADIVTPNTDMYKAWIGRLDELSKVFQTLKDAGVAPVFRPFHEMNQCVFWWSCNANSKKLYQVTHDYLVKTKGFDNIIWVWNVQDFNSLSSDVNTYNPGSEYFDIAALDVYNTGYTGGNYNAMLGASGGKLVAIAECQFMPSQSVLSSQPKWLYAMLWPDFYGNNDLPALYSAPSVLMEDEMPGWK